MSALFGRDRTDVAPGAVLLPGWLSAGKQRQLVAAARLWARPPAGLRHTTLPSGGVMSARTVCLGWHWVPYRYTLTADDGAPVKPFPGWLARIGRAALADAYGDQALADAYRPDVALVNFYDARAKMGMHVDKDEHSAAPVVSLSLGASCLFRFGNTASRNRPWQDIELESGDLFVFGAQARFSYHGVVRTLPGTGRPGIGLPAGRLSITLRESGLPRPRLPLERRFRFRRSGSAIGGWPVPVTPAPAIASRPVPPYASRRRNSTRPPVIRAAA